MLIAFFPQFFLWAKTLPNSRFIRFLRIASLFGHWKLSATIPFSNWSISLAPNSARPIERSRETPIRGTPLRADSLRPFENLGRIGRRGRVSKRVLVRLRAVATRFFSAHDSCSSTFVYTSAFVFRSFERATGWTPSFARSNPERQRLDIVSRPTNVCRRPTDIRAALSASWRRGLFCWSIFPRLDLYFRDFEQVPLILFHARRNCWDTFWSNGKRGNGQENRVGNAR